MAFFDEQEKKDKQEAESESKQKKEELDKVLAVYKKLKWEPLRPLSADEVLSKEYRVFKEEELESTAPKTLFEKLCAKADARLHIDPGTSTGKSLGESIDFIEMRATPEGVASLAVAAFAFISLIALFIAALFPQFIIPNLIKLIFFLLAPFAAFLILSYPSSRAAVLRVQTGGDLVIGVLYMIIFMKTTPSLEGAVRFAAINTTGKLSHDLKKILWLVETGEYNSLDEALTDYTMKWKNTNREFVDAVQFIRNSMLETNPLQREVLLNKSVNVILSGTNEKMQQYSRDLTMPITILHGLGILLPVMGMIIFPLMSIFMGDSLPYLTNYLFFGYNVFLPLIVFFFMKTVLDKRPATHYKIDISEHPDAMPLPIMRIGKTKMKVWPVALGAASLPAFLGILLFAAFSRIGEPDFSAPMLIRLLGSHVTHTIFMVWSVAIFLIVYYYGTSFQKVGIRDDIAAIEEEFETALFSLGNRLSSGIPVEKALRYAESDTEELRISGLFRLTLKNMTRLSMTFKQALFDKDYGALVYYPSRLIRTIMQSVSESLDKGTKATSTTMLTISEYLREIHATQEKIEDLLSEAASSMKFQAFILVPVISGVVVATAQVIMTMMMGLADKMTSMQVGVGGTGMEGMGFGALFSASPTPPWVLQLIVGLYVVEILVLLGSFINRIEVGADTLKERQITWQILLIGMISYTIVLMLVNTVFGGMIQGVMTGF